MILTETSTGAVLTRATATARPTTRINGSASKNNRTLSQKTLRMSGNASTAADQSKKVAFTVGHPGEVTITAISTPKTTTADETATTIDRSRSLRATASRSSWR